jgi:hypothetical protein
MKVFVVEFKNYIKAIEIFVESQFKSFSKCGSGEIFNY